MKRLTMTVAAIALTAGTTAWAESHSQSGEMMDNAETNMEQAADAAGTAAEETGDAIENTAEAAGETMENAAEETGDAVAEAGDAVENTAEEAEASIEAAANEVNGEMNKAADDMQTGMKNVFANDSDGLIRTRDITGGAVYAVDADGGESDWNSTASYDAISDQWDNVGEIEDIVLNADGSFEGIVAEVGGFLDIGDKHVHISLSDVRLVPVDDTSYAVVTNYTKDQLMDLEDIDESVVN